MDKEKIALKPPQCLENTSNSGCRHDMRSGYFRRMLVLAPGIPDVFPVWRLSSCVLAVSRVY